MGETLINEESEEIPIRGIAWLTREQAFELWGFISSCLDAEPGTWSRSFTKDELFNRIALGQIQVWAVYEDKTILALCMTQMINRPVGRLLQVFWAWGKGVLRLLPDIEAALDKFAIHQGCNRIQVVGRPGWVRALKKLGGDISWFVIERAPRSMKEH